MYFFLIKLNFFLCLLDVWSCSFVNWWFMSCIYWGLSGFKNLYILFIFVILAVNNFPSLLFLSIFLLMFLIIKAFVVCVVNFFNLCLYGFFQVEFKIFLDFFETYVTHGLFRNVLCNYQIWGRLSSHLSVIGL